MRAANNYLILKETKMTLTDAQQRTMVVQTNADLQLEVVSVGPNADSDQFKVGDKVVVEGHPKYYFYTDGTPYIAVLSSEVKAVL